MTLRFEIADARKDRAELLRLNVDYMSWVGEGIAATHGLSLETLLGASVPDYVAATLDKLCEHRPPHGVYYLVRRDERVVGMGALRLLSPHVAELKRFYVLPSARGEGVGTAIVARLVSDARAFGCKEMLLDSGPFMTAAHRVYEAAGFRDIPAYAEAEVPPAVHFNWRFMRMAL